MKFVSLFAGIGGLDLGLERAGHECVGQVELDDYATRILEKHWPNVPRIRDVRDFHGTEFGQFDMLVGGYPCQPFSLAGSRKGERDERHLWPEVLRILRAVRPKYLFVENVTGHLSLGFERVLGDLAESGYDAEWDCIPAAAVGAPHRRDRVFIIGHNRDVADTNQQRPYVGKSDGFSRHVCHPDGHSQEPQREWNEQQPWVASGGAHVSDTYSQRREEQHPPTIASTPRHDSRRPATPRNNWTVEPNVGRVAHGVPHRVDRLKALGNAVVPQVAQWIGMRLPL